MNTQLQLPELFDVLRSTVSVFPDCRTGTNTQYDMDTFGMTAFSTFFMQSPSFHSHQTLMTHLHRNDNASPLFKLENIPCDNQVRTVLDEVSPVYLRPVYDDVFRRLDRSGMLAELRGLNNNLLIPLDGTRYFSSKTICCQNCSTMPHKDETVTYYHAVLIPAIVVPGSHLALPLMPEFSMPQDGAKKQDCEVNAAKRWLDELEPGEGMHTVVIRRWHEGHWEGDTYRYALGGPLRDTDDALKVNWVELTTTDETTTAVLYDKAFMTNHHLTDNKVGGVVTAGRCRWKIENEDINTLKNQGYNLTHNSGHGEKFLSSLLVSLMFIAFLFHTILDLTDGTYRLLRKMLTSRKEFFREVRALIRSLCFESVRHVFECMRACLERERYYAPGEAGEVVGEGIFSVSSRTTDPSPAHGKRKRRERGPLLSQMY